MPCGKSFWARKNLLRQNCSHPPANAFLIDFGVILRSKIQILQAKARRKMRKCIVVGQFGSIPVRLSKDCKRSDEIFSKIFSSPIDNAIALCYNLIIASVRVTVFYGGLT